MATKKTAPFKCSVRIHGTKTFRRWTEPTLAKAMSSVKIAVVAARTEGEVERYNDRTGTSTQINFAWERGRLVTTKH